MRYHTVFAVDVFKPARQLELQIAHGCCQLDTVQPALPSALLCGFMIVQARASSRRPIKLETAPASPPLGDGDADGEAGGDPVTDPTAEATGDVTELTADATGEVTADATGDTTDEADGEDSCGAGPTPPAATANSCTDCLGCEHVVQQQKLAQ